MSTTTAMKERPMCTQGDGEVRGGSASHRSVTVCGRTPFYPPLDCSHEELVSYIQSMKGGERVMEMGGGCMTGCKGTVEIHEDGSVCIRWDHREYADGAGVMVTSFTGGARTIQDNNES